MSTNTPNVPRRRSSAARKSRAKGREAKPKPQQRGRRRHDDTAQPRRRFKVPIAFADIPDDEAERAWTRYWDVFFFGETTTTLDDHATPQGGRS